MTLMLQSARTTYAISAEASADSTLSSAKFAETKVLLSGSGSGSLRKRSIGTSKERQNTMLDRRSGYEYEDLLACGRGEMFGPGNAQLPLPPMLMFDRITEITEKGGEFGKGLIRAELDVKP